MSAKILDVAAAKTLQRQLDAPPRVEISGGVKAAVSARRGNSWIRDFVRTLRGPGRLSPGEFFYYRLYEKPANSKEALLFVGKRAQSQMHDASNDVRWFAASHDKLLFYTLLKGAGLPCPETVACYVPNGRRSLGAALRNGEDLIRFLTDPSVYPLFAKPVDGMYSVGALHLLGIDGTAVSLKGGGAAELSEVVEFIEAMSESGYLFQRVLEPAPDLAGLVGTTVPSVRMLLLWGEDGPAPESAVVKIPLGTSVADNFWRDGNMLGAVELETGTIRRVIRGTGEKQAEIDQHPDTGAELPGMRIPGWDQIIETCTLAAGLFPGVRTQSWDIALTSSGPVLLEFNFGGDLNLHQLAHGQGRLTSTFVAHLKRCGYKKALPAVS